MRITFVNRGIFMLIPKFSFGFLTILAIIFLARTAFPEQAQTFQIEQDGAKLECRATLLKDTLVLLDPIEWKVQIKNVSPKTVSLLNLKAFPIFVQNKKGENLKLLYAWIRPKREQLKPKDSLVVTNVSDSSGAEQLEIFPDPIFSDVFLPLGEFNLLFTSNPTPFSIKVSLNTNSKKHLRRKKFYEYIQTHPGKHYFDRSLGISTALEISLKEKLPCSLEEKYLVNLIYRYLEVYKDMFGIERPRQELKAVGFESVRGGKSVHFQQYYKGLPVYRLEITNFLTHFTPTGTLQLGASPFHPDLEISTTPEISKESATEIVKHDLQPIFETVKLRMNEMKLVVYPLKGKYYLAWHTFTHQWHYFVDAHTGSIIMKNWIPPSCYGP